MVQGTSIMVAMDMTGGIDRFRTMAIARASVLIGHVVGSLIQTLAAMAILVGVAFGLGFHSSAGPLEWLAAIGILALFAFALIWLAVALGLAAKSVETASNTPMILLLLLFLSSGFVSTATMPTGLRQFAENQPFTPVADTVRGLLNNAAIGDHAIARRRVERRHRRSCLPLGRPPLQRTPSERAKLSGDNISRQPYFRSTPSL